MLLVLLVSITREARATTWNEPWHDQVSAVRAVGVLPGTPVGERLMKCVVCREIATQPRDSLTVRQERT